MCGIFGYYNFKISRNRQDILDFLFTGLKRLEYRGYDSAGIAIDGSPPSAPISNGKGGPTANGNASGATAPRSKRRKTDPVTLDTDSASLSCTPLVIKSNGKIGALVELAYSELSETAQSLDTVFESHAGIAHTRWATHGPPSTRNAHPHVSDASHEFVVVCNGILTNFKALKDFLTKQGEVFTSDTDTEVIPKLCKYVYHQLKVPVSFTELVMEVMKQLEGAYALLFKSSRYPGELVACKRGSPLLLGIRDAPDEEKGSRRLSHISDSLHRPAGNAFEAFLASDASAVVEHTKRVIVLEDDDVVHLCAGRYGIFNAGHHDRESAVPRELQTLEMEVSNIMKGGYEHYMQKEIHEQPESLLQTMRGRVQFEPAGKGTNPYTERRIILGGLSEHLSTIRRGRRIMFCGCGTSYHAAMACRQVHVCGGPLQIIQAGKSITRMTSRSGAVRNAQLVKAVEELTEVPVTLEVASDLMDRHGPIFRDDMCVFMSQSGETADTLQALSYAKKQGALCIGVTNTVGSEIARSTHCGVHLNAGCEIGVASTKAYTSTIIAIIMMALALSEDSIQKRPLRDRIIDQLSQLPDKIREVLKLDGDMKKLALQLKNESSLLIFGRGVNYATALEAALKVKEVSVMHSEGILAGEIKHGPLALVDENMPILVIATKDRMYSKMHSVIQQLRARNARLIVVCNQGDADIAALVSPRCTLIEVPPAEDCLQPIVNIVPLQLLSYHLTVLRGFNVDQPRNLAKSVTVTEQH